MTTDSEPDDPGELPPLPERIQVSPSVLFQEIGGEGVLMDTEKEVYFSLDPMGTVIWRLLSKEPVIQRVRNQLLERYEVSAEALDNDLKEFFSRLIEAGLITAEP